MDILDSSNYNNGERGDWNEKKFIGLIDFSVTNSGGNRMYGSVIKKKHRRTDGLDADRQSNYDGKWYGKRN